MLTREGSSPFVRTILRAIRLAFFIIDGLMSAFYFVRIEIIIAETIELYVFLPFIVLFSVVT